MKLTCRVYNEVRGNVLTTGRRSGTWRWHLEPKEVHQSDAIEEPFLVPHRTFQTRVLERIISLKEFFKEPIKVSQRKGFFKAPLLVPPRTFKSGSLRHHFWFHEEPFKQGFFKEPFP